MDRTLENIESHINQGIRVSDKEALYLFENAELGYLGILASIQRSRLNGDLVFFNKNFHIEPTNICIHNCSFCSYRRRVGEDDAWEMGKDEIVLNIDENAKNTPI